MPLNTQKGQKVLNVKRNELKQEVLEFLENEIPLYINGEYQASSNNEVFEVVDPSDESVIAKVHEANEEDVDKAVNLCKRSI